MGFNRINYVDLNSKQKEIFNFQKVAGLLADYGFNCIKLQDDWNGADFLADHLSGVTLRVQLKSRITIKREYLDKNLYIVFPIQNDWYLIEHDDLVEIIGEETNWLNSNSWLNEGYYHSNAGNPDLRQRLQGNKID